MCLVDFFVVILAINLVPDNSTNVRNMHKMWVVPMRKLPNLCHCWTSSSMDLFLASGTPGFWMWAWSRQCSHGAASNMPRLSDLERVLFHRAASSWFFAKPSCRFTWTDPQYNFSAECGITKHLWSEYRGLICKSIDAGMQIASGMGSSTQKF